MLSNTFLLVTIACIVIVIILIYAIGNTGALVKTLPLKPFQEKMPHQVYYLPTATLLIKATAKLTVISNSENGKIIDAQLAALVLEPTVQIVPDTETAYGLRYVPSILANDEIKLFINSSGLMEGINLTAEDRLANIITQITEAPKIILGGDQAGAVVAKRAEGIIQDGGPITTETKEFSTSFIILTKEIKSKKAERTWKINIDGKSDREISEVISLTLQFNYPPPDAANPGPATSSPVTEIDGILTRPLQTVIMGVYRNDLTKPDAEHQILIPDEKSLIAIPLKRSAFVKKAYNLKMANGMVTENTINKPSEVEGFLSIPINIAKAIISIPAQLLSFKIERIKRETALETETQSLAKALIQNKEIAGATKDWENAKIELQALLKKIEALNANKFKN